ncbi:selenoprotein, Rdx type, partial [Kipferlia bialata]
SYDYVCDVRTAVAKAYPEAMFEDVDSNVRNAFEVTVDGTLVFSKLAKHHYPTPAHIVGQIRRMK